MYKSTLFTILFYLGCANELSVWNPQQVHISKHKGNHKGAVKLNSWVGKRYR